MKKLNQIFLFILCAFISIIQVTAQSNSNVQTADQTKEVSGKQDITHSFNKSMVQIKRVWVLVNKQTKKPFYFLYVSRQSLAQKGIKITSQAEAVPVYVKTDREYEPVLVADQGKFNVPAGEGMAARGFIVTGDGFIMTTRRVTSSSDSAMVFGDDTPNGILMSADLKKVLEVNVPPPTQWVPVKTKPQQGKLGILDIRVDFNGEKANREVEFEVMRLNDLTSDPIPADLVSVSAKHDVALLKIAVPGELPKVELNDNYDQLKNGSTDISFVYFNMFEGASPGNWSLMKAEVSKAAKSEETGDIIQIVNTLNNSGASEAEKEKLSFSRAIFKAFSDNLPGTPIFDNQGRVIGIYLGYKADKDLHDVLPIRFGKQFFAK